jgi:DNA-binding MarR family transcriptional regulator
MELTVSKYVHMLSIERNTMPPTLAAADPARAFDRPGTDCTCAALRQAARRLTQAYDAALAPQGLKTSQYSILVVLSRLLTEAGSPRAAGMSEAAPAAPSVQHLADALALDRTTLGHNLRPLQRAGLVVLARDPHDRRIHRIGLTPAGRTKLDDCLPLWRAAQARFDAGYGPERSAALRAELHAIAYGLVGTALPIQRDDDDVG